MRKVNGASTFQLVMLLTKDFSILVLIAFGIAIPLSWYAGKIWLENFAYKTEIGFLVFVVAGLVSLMLAVLTVSYHTIKAARANPVNSLRYE